MGFVCLLGELELLAVSRGIYSSFYLGFAGFFRLKILVLKLNLAERIFIRN